MITNSWQPKGERKKKKKKKKNLRSPTKMSIQSSTDRKTRDPYISKGTSWGHNGANETLSHIILKKILASPRGS